MQQQQQPPPPAHPLASMPAMPPANITTEQIQKYLDENKQLILAILENQNLGKLTECAQYQAQLQKNLLYLAAIADAQPQTPSARPQMMSPGAVPSGGHYMQQAAAFPPGSPLQLTPQQLQPGPKMLPFPGQVAAMRPGAINGMPAIHAELPRDLQPAIPGPGGAAGGRGSKQDGGGASSEPSAAENRRGPGDHGSSGGDANLSEKA